MLRPLATCFFKLLCAAGWFYHSHTLALNSFSIRRAGQTEHQASKMITDLHHVKYISKNNNYIHAIYSSQRMWNINDMIKTLGIFFRKVFWRKKKTRPFVSCCYCEIIQNSTVRLNNCYDIFFLFVCPPKEVSSCFHLHSSSQAGHPSSSSFSLPWR